MKRIVLLILFCISIISVQASSWYTATHYTSRTLNSYGNWTSWSKWEYQNPNINIFVDTDNDRITIYSRKTQVYQVVSDGHKYYDNQNHLTIKWTVIDQDLDRGSVRVVNNDGELQMYVDFANIQWGYALKTNN